MKFTAIVERSKLSVAVSGDLNWAGISGSGFERIGWIVVWGPAAGGLVVKVLLGKLKMSGVAVMVSDPGPKVPAGLMCRQLASMKSSKLVLTRAHGRLAESH
jgi:hypothetical protein